jgi:hypothetical protein
MSIYYSPEDHGLTIVGGVELSDACYQFDTVVLFRNAEGALFYAQDAGCSCPSPFEDFTSVDDLTPCTLQEFQAYVEPLVKQKEDWYGEAEASRMQGELVDLLIRARQP